MSETNRMQVNRSDDDSFRTRIAAVICGMDALHAKQWSLAVADAVIAELEADYVLVPKSHTLARQAGCCDVTWVAPGAIAKMMGQDGEGTGG